MIRRLTLVGLMSALLVLATSGSAVANHYNHLLASSTKCPGQTDISRSWSDQERIMRCMHNHARAKVGRSGLRGHSLLQTSSDAKTADMFRCRQFSHTACGRPMAYHFKRVGYTSCRSWGIAENIAWGTGSYGSVRSIASAWLHSDDHRYNILRTAFRDVGFGLRRGTFLGRSGAGVWTAHFGYRSNC